MPSRAPARTRTDLACLSPRGTRAAGPWGRPWPPPDRARDAHSGQQLGLRRLPPRRAARTSQRSRFPVRQVAARARPPRPGRARRGRRRGGELKSWNPGKLGVPTRGRFPDSQLADSRSRVSAADVNCTDMADENCTLRQAGGSVRGPGAADVWEGATSAVTSLSGAGPEQGGDRAGAGGRAANGLSLDRDRAARARAR